MMTAAGRPGYASRALRQEIEKFFMNTAYFSGIQSCRQDEKGTNIMKKISLDGFMDIRMVSSLTYSRTERNWLIY